MLFTDCRFPNQINDFSETELETVNSSHFRPIIHFTLENIEQEKYNENILPSGKAAAGAA